MDSDVKANALALLAPRPKELLPGLRMAYFLLTILLIGVPLSFLLYIPLSLLRFFLPSSQRAADFILQWGIAWLMRVQPWFDAKLDLRIPQGGVLLVSNHRSHLDMFCLLARVRGIRSLAKSSLYFIPLLNVMMLASRQIPTRRGRLDSFWAAMRTIKRRLAQGETVHVFPEMTRCRPGFSGTREFMIAPFLMAKETGRPVVPIAIRGTDEVWPRGRYSLLSSSRVSVRSLTPLDPKDFPTAEALRDATRAQIEQALL